MYAFLWSYTSPRLMLFVIQTTWNYLYPILFSNSSTVTKTAFHSNSNLHAILIYLIFGCNWLCYEAAEQATEVDAVYFLMGNNHICTHQHIFGLRNHSKYTIWCFTRNQRPNLFVTLSQWMCWAIFKVWWVRTIRLAFSPVRYSNSC